MNEIEKLLLDTNAEALGETIIKAFKRYRVSIDILSQEAMPDRIIYEIKLKGDTREVHVRARMFDVQQRLKLPLFQIETFDFHLFIIAAEHKIVYTDLPQILSDPRWRECSKDMCLPYVVGHDAVGTVVTVDLEQFPHLLLAGASNSGKTVGLQSFLISIMCSKTSSQINLILIDVGTSDLIRFNGVPHLSCPVVNDKQMAYQVLISLLDEMERRIKLQASNPKLFDQLPRLVLVVDEFPALFVGLEDKRTSKAVINAVSSLLQRGRHAKIHVVLAAQNPTIQNIKVDLGNITARIAFKCAKKNFSETIIGEGGAENLSGKGDMYFKYPQYEGLRRIQGIFISPEEIQQEVSWIKSWMGAGYHDSGFKFTIDISNLQLMENDALNSFGGETLERRTNSTDQLFANILLWTLGQETISCNLLMRQFNIGWKRANNFINRLNSLGVVEDLDTKLPRKVLTRSVEDLPERLMDFLVNHGISSEEIIDVINVDD